MKTLNQHTRYLIKQSLENFANGKFHSIFLFHITSTLPESIFTYTMIPSRWKHTPYGVDQTISFVIDQEIMSVDYNMYFFPNYAW